MSPVNQPPPTPSKGERKTFTVSFFFLFFFLHCFCAAAQILPTGEGNKVIQIINANSLRQLTIDSATILKTLSGNAIVRQGNTTLSGDSIILNEATGIAEVFGNIHINDADSVHTYAEYLKYIGSERIAFLKRNVKFTDGRGILYTNDLEYNLQSGIAKYKNGGRVVNGTTILTSTDAIYYSDTKDVYFKKYVHLVDPKYDIKADSLLYNTSRRTATFISPTHIISKNGIIDTRSGTYNLQSGEARFFNRTAFKDNTHFITGNNIAYDEKAGLLQIEDNGKLVDSVNQVVVLGNQILLNKLNNSFLATRKPVMIFYKNNDSTYISADTLFSGLKKYDSTLVQKTDLNDSLNKNNPVNLKSPDSIRYFLAFHHVKIFNDSLQAVSDSLYYSTLDSTFCLLGNPVFWNAKTQVNGDTMFLYTQNQKAKRLYVFYNSMVINKTPESLYNQIAGRTLNAYFKAGEIEYIRVKGSPAESIFYPQNEDSSYAGMNRSSGELIDVNFVKKELNKVKFVKDVDGTLYPIKQIPSTLKYLKNFNWQDKRRPKNKLELFE